MQFFQTTVMDADSDVNATLLSISGHAWPDGQAREVLDAGERNLTVELGNVPELIAALAASLADLDPVAVSKCWERLSTGSPGDVDSRLRMAHYAFAARLTYEEIVPVERSPLELQSLLSLFQDPSTTAALIGFGQKVAVQLQDPLKGLVIGASELAGKAIAEHLLDKLKRWRRAGSSMRTAGAPETTGAGRRSIVTVAFDDVHEGGDKACFRIKGRDPELVEGLRLVIAPPPPRSNAVEPEPAHFEILPTERTETASEIQGCFPLPASIRAGATAKLEIVTADGRTESTWAFDVKPRAEAMAAAGTGIDVGSQILTVAAEDIFEGQERARFTITAEDPQAVADITLVVEVGTDATSWAGIRPVARRTPGDKTIAVEFDLRGAVQSGDRARLKITLADGTGLRTGAFEVRSRAEPPAPSPTGGRRGSTRSPARRRPTEARATAG